MIFRKAQNKIQDPAKLRRLIVDLIDGETWTGLDADVKGDDLRGPAGEERPGHQVRRRAVLHPAPADRGDRRRDAPRARPDRSATRPAAPAASCSPPTTTSPRTTALDRDQKAATCGTRRCTAGRSWTHRPPLRDEPATCTASARTAASRPIRVDDSLAADPGDALRHGADQSAVRQEVQRHVRQRRGRDQTRGPDDRARRLLGHDQQQAAQLRPARQDAS